MALTDEEQAALQAQLEAERAKSAEQAAGLRKLQIGNVLREINASGAFAEVYPADGEITPDALKTFVSQFVPAAPTTSTTTTTTDMGAWAAYERAQESATTPGAGGKTEVESLLEKGEAGLYELTGKGKDWNHYRIPMEGPGSDIEQRNNDYAEAANKVNRQWSKEVRQGRAQPAGIYSGANGFGGRVDPPRWAYKALDGQE